MARCGQLQDGNSSAPCNTNQYQPMQTTPAAFSPHLQDVSSLKDFLETNLDLADPNTTMGVRALCFGGALLFFWRR